MEAMRLYLTLPNCRLFDDAANYARVICPFGAALLSLADNPSKVIGKCSKLGIILLEAGIFHHVEGI